MNASSLPVILCSLVLLLISPSCTFTEKIKDGRTAFERKRYFQAAEMLQVEFENARTNADRMNIAYLIGESNLKFGNFPGAAEWFKIAYEGGYGTAALSAYAACLKQSEKYEEAAANYAKAGDEIGDRVKYRREMAVCLQAAEWRNDAVYSPYVIENLGMNSSASDYAAIPLSSSEIAFTSDREISTGEYKYAWSGNDFSDIFRADLSQNSVTQYGGEVINIDENEGTVSISPDGTKMIFCRCFSREDYDAHCKLLVSERLDDAWSKPVILPFIKDGINYRHPAFSEDGSKLIFSANIEEETNGYDLYLSELVDGNWEQPVSLGPSINTQAREGFPFMYEDTLYFSSDVGGMGGLDIYKTWILPEGRWQTPINLRAPINSGADDFAYVINRYFEASDSILEQGYFSSNRQGGKGSDDIYLFEKRKYHPVKPEPEEVFEYEIVLDLRVFQRQYEDENDPNSKVIMRVPLADASISITEDGIAFEETASNRYGILSIDLNPEKEYEFFVSHPGFFNNELIFSTKDLEIDSTTKVQKFEERILLDKIFYDKEIVLENIYYDLDESFIRDDAKPTLDSLANLLKLNPQIKIQLSSHTDCRAPDDYNERLSQARAQSAVDYLVSNGIASDRMVAKGYGESQLAIDCVCEECTEEQHQANRRTTFKVVE
ncbi:MAG: OmpA family protein [Saprospiraceae bacterium]|nr:OmpA family protein [Saprospiraceae bacterium]